MTRMSAAESLRQAVKLREAGQAERAMALLRESLLRGGFTGEQIGRAGRFIQRELTSDAEAHRVLILGQCTTTWLANALTAHAWSDHMPLSVRDGEYDNVMQELLRATDGDPVGTVVLVPWCQRLIGGGDRTTEQRIDDELGFWQQAWSIVLGQLKARVVQVGYDCDTSGPLGASLAGSPAGPVGLLRQVNESLRRTLPDGGYFLDLDRVAGQMGRERFYDPRRYHWTRQPFSEAGTSLLGEHLAAGIRAVTAGPKKVLVLDLDNTLWGGVVGETGPLGITLGESPDGEAFLAFQEHLKGLAQRGVLLAVCSKNNPDDAREPFEKHPDMALALDDFAAFEASWDAKPTAIERIAQTLKLGLDSFVFFDDNPAEREHVRQSLPEVQVVDVPQDPSDFVRALEAGLWFEAIGVSAEDRQRAKQYATEHKRRAAQEAFGSIDDYLRSLDMIGDPRNIDDPDLQRVVQLLGKTNQFNLTTRRHSADVVRAILAIPGAIGLTLRLRDRFGDHGLVSLVLAVPEEDSTLRIDSWLMSCRVIGRTTEQFLFDALLARAKEQGYQQLIGEYLPTAKNALVADLYDRLGFTQLAEHPDGRVEYSLDAADATPPTTHIRSAEASHR